MISKSMTHLENRLAKRGLSLGPKKIREQAAAAIVTAMIAEKDKIADGCQPTLPGWSDSQSIMRACDRIAENLMRRDWDVAWPDDATMQQLKADGVRAHSSINELIVACIRKHVPASPVADRIEAGTLVFVKLC